MPLRIAVIDDSSADASNAAELLNDWAGSRSETINQALFASAEEFLFAYSADKCWDILLLDIEMRGMDGIALAKRIRAENDAVQIVFLTGHSDYIAEGYDVSALHYMMKPAESEKFFGIMDRAAERLRRDERTLTFKTSDELMRIPLGNIVRLEASRNYVNIRDDSGRIYEVRKKLGDFEKELDYRFFRVGRSYIVNLSKLRRVGRSELQFSDGSVIPLPRGCYDAVNRAIIERL